MKMFQLVNTDFFQALTQLAKMELPVASAYKLADILDKCNQEQMKFTGIRKSLLEKYGAKTKSGKLRTTKDGTKYVMRDQEAFDKEYKDLVELDIILPQISLEDLGNIKISAEMLNSLRPLIKTKV